jgi:hypothetical protein
MKKSLVVSIAVATALGASGTARADVIPPGETACQGLSLGAVCNVGTCEQRTCGRLTYTTNDAGVMVPGSYQYPCLYCMDVGRVPDAGASADADVSADAGASADAEVSADAGASADAEVSADAGASADADVSADANASADAGASADASPTAIADASAITQPAASPDPGEDSSCAVGRFSAAARSVGPWLLALVAWVPIAISRARRRRRGE